MTHLDSNLELLARNNPRLAEKCRTCSPLDPEWIENSRTGEPVIRAAAPGGEELFLHSRYNPQSEAVEYVDSCNIGPRDTVFIFGFAFGYHVLEIVRRLDQNALIVVVESNLKRFRTALEFVDFSPLLSRSRVEFIVGESLMSAFDRLRPFLFEMFTGRIALVFHPPSLRADTDFYDTARKDMQKFTDAARVILGTTFGLARTTLINRLKNIVDYVLSPKIEDFAGKFAGYPAFIVSAGPSLAASMEELREVGGRGIVIAVSTAFKRLLDENIPVDFTVVLDYHRISKRYFENISGDIRVPLIAESKANSDAVSAYHGPKIFPQDSILNTILGREKPESTEFETGATVAHTAFLFARHAGCDPIIFVGQDLSYPHGLTHLPGTAIHTQWLGELNRFNTYEAKEWDSLMRLGPVLMSGTDINGNPVYTDELMMSYIADFEAHFAATDATILNATEGGLPMKGAENVKLADIVKKYIKKHAEGPYFTHDLECNTASAEKSGDLSGALKTVQDFEQRAGEMENILDFMIERVRRIRNRLEKNKNADVLIKELGERQRELGKYNDVLSVVTNLVRSNVHERDRADREIEAARLEGTELAVAEAARDYAYVSALRHGSRYLRKLLAEAVARIDASIKES